MLRPPPSPPIPFAYDTTGPIATGRVGHRTQTATTSSGPVEFAVTFDESVTGFTTGDITISGTAGATAGTITGSGNAYTVTVSAIPTDGTIVLTVAAGAVSDIAGNASTTTVTASTVVFQTVPGAPTAPNAVAGDATATVSWATPAVTGGRPIIGYRIEQSTNGGVTWTTAIASTGNSATTAAISGLVNGTGVRFRIAAINTVGTSTASAATATVTPVAATPPNVTPVEPGRIHESRTGNPEYVTVDGQSQGNGRTPARGITEIKVTGRANVKPDAEAVFLNVVAVSPSGPGFLTVFPCGTEPPNAANINYVGGDVAANAVLAKIGDGGKICVFTLAETDLIIDVNGYTPAGAGTQSVQPGRVYESRTGNPEYVTVDGQSQGNGRTPARGITEIRVTDRANVKPDAEAVFLNVVAVNPSAPGYLTVFPCGTKPPNAANVNYIGGDVAANAVLAKIGNDGKICVYTSAETDLIIDINGYTPAGAGTQSVQPGRVYESRTGNPEYVTVDGQSQGNGRTPARGITEIRVTDRANVKPDAEAVFLNVVAVNPSAPGYLTVFPCGTKPPNAANVNYVGGDVAANAVLAKIGNDGKICVYTSAETDLIIDINGYVPGS